MSDLITIDDVLAAIGPDVPFESNDVLASLITSSSQWVLSQLGRPLISAEYTETRDGNGRARMLLDQCPPTPDSPPISVTSVTVDGVLIPERPAVSASATDPDGWVLRKYGIDLRGYAFTKGSQNVTIAYTVGYAACPDDLAQAVIEHVMFKHRRRTSLGSGSASVAGDSVTYSDVGVLAGINDAIDRYRAMGVG
jgi:hypothetical protein